MLPIILAIATLAAIIAHALTRKDVFFITASVLLAATFLATLSHVTNNPTHPCIPPSTPTTYLAPSSHE